MFRRILCPVDFSEPSRQALLRAAELAQQFGAALELVHAYRAPTSVVPGFVPLPSEVERLLAAVDRALAEWAGWARSLGAVEVTTRSVQGDAAGEIAARASEGDFDLVVIGTHGYSGVRHAVLGSVAERVVRSAPCPVLTVRAPAVAK